MIGKDTQTKIMRERGAAFRAKYQRDPSQNDVYRGFHFNPPPQQSFEVFFISARVGEVSVPELKEGWYWWPCDAEHAKGNAPPDGPFPTAEGAYLAAIGD